MVAERAVIETPGEDALAEALIAEAPIAEAPKRWRWTQRDYQRAAELGIFDNKRVQLIEGEIIEMNAMGDRHGFAVIIVSDVLRVSFGEGFFVLSQIPLRFSPTSNPEPDIAIIRGNVRDHKTLPSTAALVVEVSDTTLRYDREQKSSLYAKAGIPEYWILNLIDNRLEVHREPTELADQPFGWGYTSLQLLMSQESISPLAAPNATIAIADLLP